MRMKVLALCFSMTLTVSALAGNGRLTIQAATSQESSGTNENDCQTTDGRSPQGGKRTGRCQKPLKNRDAGTKGSGKIEGKGI